MSRRDSVEKKNTAKTYITGRSVPLFTMEMYSAAVQSRSVQ